MSDYVPQDPRYAKLVDRYAKYVKSPILRLKFLNNTMKARPERDWAARLPIVRSLPARAMLIMELSKVLPPNEPAPLALRLTCMLYRMRHAVYAFSLLLLVAAGTGVIYGALRIANSLSVPTEARNTVAQQESNVSGAQAVTAIGSEAGLGLDKVWLAESGEGYEFYSNGARVLTQYETDGPARSFYSFQYDALANGSTEFEILSKPVGIIYHLSEGDLLPFADKYNSKLQTHSKYLLEYARENRLYNYLIDRFGRIYRLVRDEYAANHAGNSIWGDNRKVFVNLSPSFIGICFEGKSEAGRTIGPNGINEAQVYAARVLTAVLRSKYEIEDGNCVTHGLVSINPANKLMGYHTDWVSSFPFEALGLSNKYETELIAVSRFGFGYDQAYINAAGGKRWAGLDRTDEALRSKDEETRRARWQLYQRAYAMQRALDGLKPSGGE